MDNGKSAIRRFVAKRIKLLRKSKNLNQTALAYHLGFTPRHVQKIESGQVDLSLSTLQKLAEAFKIPVCFLINNPGMMDEVSDPPLYCEATLLDLLPVGVQFNDCTGKILYANALHRSTLELTPDDIKRGVYIWDFFPTEKERTDLKIYFQSLVENQIPPRPYFAKNKTKSGYIIPIKVECNYTFSADRRLAGFLSTITYHPSW